MTEKRQTAGEDCAKNNDVKTLWPLVKSEGPSGEQMDVMVLTDNQTTTLLLLCAQLGNNKLYSLQRSKVKG